MNKDIIEKKLDQERVEQELFELDKIWITDGYIEEYTSEEGKVFSSPFHMADVFLEEDHPEKEEAFKRFESRLLRTKVGQNYVRNLLRIDPYRVEYILSQNARDPDWDIEGDSDSEINRRAILIGNLSPTREGEPEVNLSGKFVRYLMNDYLLRNEIEEIGDKEFDRLENRRLLVYTYFENYGVRDIGYWSTEEGVNMLHRYSKVAGMGPVELLRIKYERYQFSDSDRFEEYEQRMEEFEDIWELLEFPGLVEGKYEDLRDSFIKRLYSPNVLESFKQVFGKGRKNPYLRMLNQIHKFSKDESSLYQGVSKKFMSNILFDPKLFILVEGLRQISEEEKDRGIFKKYSLDITFEEVFEASMQNPRYRSLEWFASGGERFLQELVTYSPKLYILIVDSYLDQYLNRAELSRKESVELGVMLKRLFSMDMRDLYKGVYERTEKEISRFDDSKFEGMLSRIFRREYEEHRLRENLEFFEDTRSWTTHFKSEAFSKTLVELFNSDIDMFNFLIDRLMEHSDSQKESNYFDNVRMFNIVGKKLHEQTLYGTVTVEDILGEERDRIEERIIKDIRKLCTQPEVRVTVNISEQETKDSKGLLLEYLKQYSEIVSPLDLDKIRISQRGNTINLSSRNITPELTDAIRGLGLEFIKETNRFVLKIGSRQKFFERILGILISPTLYEWVEDDKNNTNPQNEKLRTLFFVPPNIKVEFLKDESQPFLYTSFSPLQKKYFIQNYLQWYLKVKYTAGDIQSSNTVISTWLADTHELRDDLYNQGNQISKETARVWKDLEDALAITFDYERFRRSDLLNKFLLAVNIEQLVPLINEDRFQTSLIAASILKSALKIAKEERVFRGIMQTSATLRNEFEGITSLTYIAEEKKERINRALKRLGFTEGEDGLQMFRNIWVNFWYLRGYRGESQTLKITSAGIEISNPKRSMYEYERRTQGPDKKPRRRYDGGQDKLIISWPQIRSVNETKIDMIPMKDVLIRIFTSFASITKQKTRPNIVTDIENQGPGNIILKLPGRDEPLCEIFAIRKPMEFWKLIQNLSKLMMDEEASADALELLKSLEKN